MAFKIYRRELANDLYRVISSFVGISGKNIILKSMMMGINFIIYALALKFIGPIFAIIHAGSLLTMNVFKAGGVFNAISEGGGAVGFVKKNLVARLALCLAWFFSFSLIFDVDIFYISLVGIPLSGVWLSAYDKHIAGDRMGGVLLSVMPVGLSGLLFILIELSSHSQMRIETPETPWIFLLAGILLIACFFLRSQLGNTIAELLNANISPVLIAYIVSLNLGESAWLYLIIFKMAEALSQLLIFIFTGARKKTYAMIDIKKYILVVLLIMAIFISIVFKFLEYPLVFFVCLWPLYNTLYLWSFLRYQNKWAVYYVSVVLFSLSIGVYFPVEILVCILIVLVAMSMLVKYSFVNSLESVFNDDI